MHDRRRNIELKARLADLQRARETAQRLGAARQPPQHQIDTYFHCRAGRLKLREINGQSAQLIGYARADQPRAKGSDYSLVDISQPAVLKETLARALGRWLVVEKHREIYLWENVRIHLDEVAGLGTFLEFEAVLDAEHDDQRGRKQVHYLAHEFGLADADLVDRSYSDLLAQMPPA